VPTGAERYRERRRPDRGRVEPPQPPVGRPLEGGKGEFGQPVERGVLSGLSATSGHGHHDNANAKAKNAASGCRRKGSMNHDPLLPSSSRARSDRNDVPTVPFERCDAVPRVLL
jgi:hypothetical protein